MVGVLMVVSFVLVIVMLFMGVMYDWLLLVDDEVLLL